MTTPRRIRRRQPQPLVFDFTFDAAAVERFEALLLRVAAKARDVAVGPPPPLPDVRLDYIYREPGR